MCRAIYKSNGEGIETVKTAIVCDWLVTYAGAERVIEQILQLFPDADLYSIVDFIKDDERDFLLGKPSTTTFIQQLPFAKKKYRQYLPLMPLAIEQHDLSKYDVIISSSHAVAKGVLTGPDQLHISYVHSPIRYAWDLQHQYLQEAGLNNGIKSWGARAILHYMRIWDSRTANGVDYFIANSQFIARRIWKVYRRKAVVIYPPVDVEAFTMQEDKDDFYLTVSRMVPYKKMDVIVEAFSEMSDKKLIVIGDGPDFGKIRRKAGKNIELLGHQPFNVLKKYMQRAKAFVFAAEEDFGIAPVEAQACGTPVVAFGKGGVLETVQPLGGVKPTGLFFDSQTTNAIKNSIAEFETHEGKFLPVYCRENAMRFSSERFRREFHLFVEKKYDEFHMRG